MTNRQKTLQGFCKKTAELLGFGANWNTGAYMNPDGKMCLVGAFSKAHGHVPHRGTGGISLRKAMGLDGTNFRSVEAFNDQVADGAEDIIGIMDQLSVEVPKWYR